MKEIVGIAFENPEFVAGLPAAVAVAAGAYYWGEKHVPPALVAGGVDELLAMDTLSAVRQEHPAKRWLGVMGLLAAVGVGSLHAAGPERVTTVDNPDARIEVVIDSSYAMTFTRDMQTDQGTVSRYEAATIALRDVVIDKPAKALQLELISGANAPAVKSAAGSDGKTLLEALSKAPTDQNGVNVDQAITLAANQLPANTQGEKTAKAGSIIVVSDGVAAQTKPAQSAIEQAVASGAKVTVIVPGTKDGTFQLNTFDQSHASAPQSEAFEAGKVSPKRVDSADALQESLQTAIETGSTTTERRPFPYFGYTAVGLMLASAAELTRERLKKRI